MSGMAQCRALIRRLAGNGRRTLVRIIFIFVVAVIVYMVLRALLAKRKLGVGQFFGIYVATLIGLALLFLGVTGRLHPLAALLGAVLPFVMRWLPMLFRGAQIATMFQQQRRSRLSGNTTGPQTSEISSRFVHMMLIHDTGMMDGIVLEGSYKDAKLSQLTLEDLLALLKVCEIDRDSHSLLMAYLDRVHAGWQTQYQDPGTAHDNAGDDSAGAGDRHQTMTDSEALDILGLAADATSREIVEAHRRLIQKIHPDRGGSTYLASKINAAKELLIKHRGKADRSQSNHEPD